MTAATRAACLLLAVAVVGCGAGGTPSPAEDAGPVWLHDLTEEAGIDFVHDCGPIDDRYFMPQIVGSGVAIFDYDNDGLPDLFLLQAGGPGGKPSRLYKQLPGGRFKDVTEASGLIVKGHSQGVAAGDVNNDGHPDVLVSQYGGVLLFLNNGDGTFTEVTKAAKVTNGSLWATSVSFLDYDRDGWLDIFLTNYVAYDPTWPCRNVDGRRDYCAPKTFSGTVSRLLRNKGPAGKGGPGKAALVTFEDVSLPSKVGLKPGPGLGVVCADFTGDGWVDVFVANDGAPNHLWVNQKDGTFKEEATPRGLAFNAMGHAEANMGIGWGDVDGDGLQDVFVTHLDFETNTLWRQGPPGQFTDWTVASRMHRPKWKATGFGTALGDFDRDGHLDAAVVNGAVSRGKAKEGSPLGPFWSQYAQRNQLFANDGKGRFRDISPSNPALCGYDNVGRTLAMGDLRNDGHLWLVASAVGGRVRLLKCAPPGMGHWLGVRAFDPERKRDALGADVRIRAGGRVQVRTAHTGGSFLCSNDPRVHFGLGKETEVEWAEVRWPDGTRERFAGGKAGRMITLERGKGKAVKTEGER